MADIFTSGGAKDARIGPQAVAVPLATLYTAAEPVLFKQVTLSNTNAAARTLTLYLVPVGSAASTSNALLPGITLPPNDTATYNFGDRGIPMVLNDKIQIEASGTGVNITAVVSRNNR